jgi:opacity protein-like surface antigen
MAMIRGDVNVDPAATAERFTGGQLRAKLSPHSGIEVSLDRRVQDSVDFSHRVSDYPLQGSFLLFPIQSTVSPYVLGGLGWYTQTVEDLSGTHVVDSVNTHKIGWHAGFGAELRVAKHAAAHADYRYTFIHFGDNTGATSGTTSAPATGSLATRFLPSYDGSMWTAGVTFYF